MKKKLKISLEKAKELYKEGGAIKELLLDTFTEKELKGTREFSDIDHRGFFMGSKGTLHDSIGNFDDINVCKGDWPTKAMAEAQLAMSQLAWWMRQPEYNGEDQDKWCDWIDHSDKYILFFYGDEICAGQTCPSRCFLSFKTEEIRDRFLEDHRELIEKAKPLL